jgi:hypothetical protein
MGRGAYAAEAVGLAGFLLVVGIVDSVVFAPESPVSGAIGSDWVKRAIVGVSAGLYLIALVYSPVGKESGAHITRRSRWRSYASGRSTRCTPGSTSRPSSSAPSPGCSCTRP